MVAKKFKNELITLKKELERLKKKENEMNNILASKETSEKMSSNLLTLFKIMMDENKATRLLIQQTYEKISRLEEGMVIDENTKTSSYNDVDNINERQSKIREIAISDLDKKIIQYIQIKGMASASDIQKIMNYKGKNAASARLTKLYKEGILERYQLGHKVFYKFDAGKATANLLIISPP
ncbi:MAG: winged helix-turn-helix domain-containing protein [Candidatus Micrarchaeia archaeon]